MTLAISEENRRRNGAERQRLLHSSLRGISVQSHQNAGFAWVPLGKGIRYEPIVTRLKEQGIVISGAELFATSAAVPQALRLAFGGVSKDELNAIVQNNPRSRRRSFSIVGESRIADFRTSAANTRKVLRPDPCHLKLRCAVDEWQQTPLPSSEGNYAGAATIVLRAHAARNLEVQNGLGAALQRCSDVLDFKVF